MNFERKTVKKGHILSFRHHGKVLFFDLIEVNSIKETKVMTKNPLLISFISRISRGSWISFTASLEKNNSNNWIIDRVKLCKYNHSNLDFNQALKWNSSLKKRYRWLYFRNSGARKILFRRQQMLNLARSMLVENGFLEVQTPILTAPVDEGSRGFLVPSRLHSGKFYSLAQSPQIYKQVLTYGGINYFQIAPVFRDEDGRQDRTNGEFYQIDIEKITDDVENIIFLAVNLIKGILRSFEVSYEDKGTITYHECLKRFNTDKPLGDELPSVESFVSEGKSLNIIVVTNFPMFKEKGGLITYTNNPFGKSKWSDLKNPLTAASEQFDLVLSGVEMMSGGLRETNGENLLRNFKTIGKEEKQLKERYSSIFEALKSGIAQHGGFALGVERLLKMINDSLENITLPVNEMLAFPLDDGKQELITKAPWATKEK